MFTFNRSFLNNHVASYECEYATGREARFFLSFFRKKEKSEMRSKLLSFLRRFVERWQNEWPSEWPNEGVTIEEGEREQFLWIFVIHFHSLCAHSVSFPSLSSCGCCGWQNAADVVICWSITSVSLEDETFPHRHTHTHTHTHAHPADDQLNKNVCN